MNRGREVGIERGGVFLRNEIESGGRGTTTEGGGAGEVGGGAEKGVGVALHLSLGTGHLTTVHSDQRHHQCISKSLVKTALCNVRNQMVSPINFAMPVLSRTFTFLLFHRRVGGRSPDVEPPSEERDKRTVMCMQLSAHVGPSELEEFFQKVGQVKEVKMIADKNSRRSKGIAYVEFHDEKSIPGVSLSL